MVWQGPCEAKILELFDHLRHSSFSERPVSDIPCPFSATGDVCGVRLCDTHRRMVTSWEGGRERLRELRAERLFAAWGVERAQDFVGEHELYPLRPEGSQ